MTNTMKEKRFKPSLLKGFRDIFPQEVAFKTKILQKISEICELYGYIPLSTPALEYVETLGKFLPESDQPDGGIFSFKDEDENWVALRYDLTAPLSRFIAINSQLPKPFKRYQYGSVWRMEKPAPGRFREFTQFDFDVVGAPGQDSDVELCMIMAQALENIGLAKDEYRIRINDRRILNGVIEKAGIDALDQEGQLNEKGLTVLRAIDKLDRLGIKGIAQLLGEGRKDESGDFTKGAGLKDQQIQIFTDYLSIPTNNRKQVIQDLRALIGDTPSGAVGISSLVAMDTLFSSLDSQGDCFVISPTVVRGLSYYTGPVYEAEIISRDSSLPDFGSIGGGGRYDDLVERFTGQKIPSAGASIGVDRLLSYLEAKGQSIPEIGPQVMISVLEKNRLVDYHEMASLLRKNRIKTNVFLGNGGLGKQAKYADKQGCTVLIIAGSDEFKQDQITLKDLKLGAILSQEIKERDKWRIDQPAQITIPKGKLLEGVTEILNRYKSQ